MYPTVLFEWIQWQTADSTRLNIFPFFFIFKSVKESVRHDIVSEPNATIDGHLTKNGSLVLACIKKFGSKSLAFHNIFVLSLSFLLETVTASALFISYEKRCFLRTCNRDTFSDRFWRLLLLRIHFIAVRKRGKKLARAASSEMHQFLCKYVHRMWQSFHLKNQRALKLCILMEYLHVFRLTLHFCKWMFYSNCAGKQVDNLCTPPLFGKYNGS